MLRFIFNKVFYTFLRLFGIVIVIFFLFNTIPRNSSKISKKTYLKTNVDKKNFPIFTNLIFFLNDLSPISIHKNNKLNLQRYNYIILFKISRIVLVLKCPYLGSPYESKIRKILFKSLQLTCWLILFSIILSSVFGLIFGVLAGMNRHHFLGRFIMILSEVVQAIPPFVFAIFIALAFDFYLLEYIHSNFLAIEEKDYMLLKENTLKIQDIIPPTLALSILPSAIITRLLSMSIKQIFEKHYIFTAKAKGLNTFKIIFHHAAKNIIFFTLKYFSSYILLIILNIFFVEYIFNWRGIGYLAIVAIHQLDIPLIIASVLLITIFYLFIQFIIFWILFLLKRNEGFNI